MKIFQFSRPFTPPGQNSVLPRLTFDVQFQTNPPPPTPSSSNDNQSIKRKHNPRMTVISYQVFPSGRLLFSVSTH